jgi:hypothetical protein
VDVFIQADFKFLVGLVQVETEGNGSGLSIFLVNRPQMP